MPQGKSYSLVEFGQPLQELPYELPEPTGTEILLRVNRSGVCHSDLHLMKGTFDLGAEGEMRMVDRGMRLPKTLGHEIVGTVIAVGPEVEQVRLGQVMLVFPWLGCGTCRACDDGRENDCMAGRLIGLIQDGGYATHVKVESPDFLIDVGDLNPDTVAPQACSGLTVYNALGKLGKPNHQTWIAILGVGGLGLNAIAIARALGFENIVAVDIDDEKLAAAEHMGASARLHAQQDSAIDALRRITGGALTGVLDTVGGAGDGKARGPCLDQGRAVCGGRIIWGRFQDASAMAGAEDFVGLGQPCWNMPTITRAD